MFKNVILDCCRKDKKCKEKKNWLQFFPEIIIDYISRIYISVSCFCAISNTCESSASFCDYLIFHACLI